MLRGHQGGDSTLALNEGRGVSPGDTLRIYDAIELNEGRGVSPGDTHRQGRQGSPPLAQTKAGA